MSAATPAKPAAGVVMAGRYEISDRIAGGGMGDVWRAVDLVLGRTVAIKFLRAEFADDELFRERLRREARAAGSISHRGVVPVFDYGEIAREDAAYLAFIVMEYVDGPSLSTELAQFGRLGTRRTLLIIEQTAAALQAAHDAGVVHRDVKPGNILLTPQGDIKITDFGIARAADSVPLTRTGTLTGTALYLSPEQATGKSATAASDIYSLGVVAYACLAGQVPFTEGNDLTIALAHLQQEPPDLPAEVPEGLRDLVMSMLAKNPVDRPAAARDIAALARRMLHVAGPAAASHDPFGAPTAVDGGPHTQVLAAATAVVPGPSTRMNLPTAKQPARQRRRVRIGAVALSVALLVAGLFAVLTSGGTDVPAVVGKTRGAAEALLARSDLTARVRTADVPGRQAGIVLAQSAAAGDEVDDGSAITLTVSSGKVALPVDKLLGSTSTVATSLLTTLGLTTITTSQTSSETAGTVIGISREGRVDVGSTVELTIASDPAPATALKPAYDWARKWRDKGKKRRD